MKEEKTTTCAPILQDLCISVFHTAKFTTNHLIKWLIFRVLTETTPWDSIRRVSFAVVFVVLAVNEMRVRLFEVTGTKSWWGCYIKEPRMEAWN